MKSKGEGFLYFCLKFAILSVGRETSTLSQSEATAANLGFLSENVAKTTA
jgi:hypothetical protein